LISLTLKSAVVLPFPHHIEAFFVARRRKATLGVIAVLAGVGVEAAILVFSLNVVGRQYEGAYEGNDCSYLQKCVS